MIEINKYNLVFKNKYKKLMINNRIKNVYKYKMMK